MAHTLPQGWEVKKISDLVNKMTAGVSVNSTDKPAEHGQKGVLKTSSVTLGQFNPNENKAIVNHEIDRAKVNPVANSIIMSRMNTPLFVGASAYVKEDYPNLYLPDRLWLLTTKTTDVHMPWLAFMLGSDKYRFLLSSIATGSSNSMKNITKEDILSSKIATPPLPEQKAIADTLSLWDQAIEKTERLIQAKERKYAGELSKKLLADYPRRIKLKPFLAEISKRNKDRAITQVLSVTNSRGFVLPEEQFDRQVASSNLSNYKIVSAGQYAYNPSRINVGSIARLDGWEEGVLSPMYTVFEISKKNKINTNLFMHWLNSYEARQRIKSSAQGSVRETVSFEDFCVIGFPEISIEAQTHLADYFDALTKEIELLKRILDQYKTQKSGLMQKLLSGQWRVKEDTIKTFN